MDLLELIAQIELIALMEYIVERRSLEAKMISMRFAMCLASWSSVNVFTLSSTPRKTIRFVVRLSIGFELDSSAERPAQC